MPPTIAFLTDFGTRDHYVGAMKGAALSVCPEATLVDITHDVDPQDVVGGALELAAAFPYFPAGTVFVAVVDPGVGSRRRALAGESGGFRFVGPDNGILSLALGADAVVVELTEPRYAREVVSRTFEGRDRFAPAAAWLARGTRLGDLGPYVRDWQRVVIPAPQRSDGAVAGEVLRIDRFGNLRTSIHRADVDALGRGTGVEVTIGPSRAVVPLVGTYAEGEGAPLCALFGSTGALEIASSGGSAAAVSGLSAGAPVVVRRR